jgi:Response receiver domain
MTEASKADVIRQAYLKPIRTVVLIDDEFPTYDRLGALPAPPAEAVTAAPASAAEKPEEPGTDIATQTILPRLDYERARSLWSACRNLGYLCDIDDGARIAAELPPHLDKSDLVILDYHLQGQDPSLALRILKHLARTDHASLVVVYTRDTKLHDVRRRVAAHLRGACRPESFLTPDELELWEGMEDWSPTPSETTLDAFLRNDRKTWCADKDLRAELEARGIARDKCTQMVRAALESFIETAYRTSTVTPDALPVIQMSAPDAPRIWVHTENLFVAFVQKTEDNSAQGGLVFDALQEALKDWNPPYLPTVLAYARGVVARGGFRSENITLSDPLLQAGWMYHSICGAAEERSDRLRGLFDRLLSRHTEALLAEIAEFGRAGFPGVEDPADALPWAKGIVPGVAGCDDWHIFHRLNEFLATEPPGSFMQTGTVFQMDMQPGEQPVVWVCATPACDLVPRIPRPGTWEHTLHPLRPVQAFRGLLINSGETILRQAERFHHVFLTVKSERIAVKVVESTDPNAKLEMFFLDDMGRIENGSVKAMRLSKSGDGILSITAVMLRVIGQLRALYANRILQLAGYHMSRIGVDFVDMPPPSARPK